MYPGQKKIEDLPYPQLSSTSDVPVNVNCESVMDIDYNAATFEVMYKINPIPAVGLGILVGPSFDFILTKNMRHEYNIIYPNNAQFGNVNFERLPTGAVLKNNDRTLSISDAEIEDAGAIRIGLKIGVQYEILLGSKLYIAPSACYNLGITPVTSKYS